MNATSHTAAPATSHTTSHTPAHTASHPGRRATGTVARATLTLLSALALGLGALAAPASADHPTPPYRPLAGVGSDTTQDVMNGLGEVAVDVSGNKLLGSWNATGTPTITTKDPALYPNCQNIPRPNGTSPGVSRLVTDLNNPLPDCADYARATYRPPAPSPQLTYIPFAKDALTYVTDLGSTLPTNLTIAQLASIYRTCTFVDGGVTRTVSRALLPPADAGSFNSWLQFIGVTEQQIALAKANGCVHDVQPNDGTAVLSGTEIMPFSVAQWIGQGKGLPNVVNRRGETRLRSIASVLPTTGSGTTLALNVTFPFARDVYNVVATSRLGEAGISRAFVGASSQVCLNIATIKNYGFGDLSADAQPSSCGVY